MKRTLRTLATMACLFIIPGCMTVGFKGPGARRDADDYRIDYASNLNDADEVASYNLRQ